jgi:hypothetical protein
MNNGGARTFQVSRPLPERMTRVTVSALIPIKNQDGAMATGTIERPIGNWTPQFSIATPPHSLEAS